MNKLGSKVVTLAFRIDTSNIVMVRNTLLERLYRRKKSEKLEAVKMESKATFVAKVGSIFGDGKLKKFEHRNEDLQNRI